jgi:hypothetical protein
VTVKQTPILFSAPMVCAILEGRKTQTRRIVKPQPPFACEYVINGAYTHALCRAIGKPDHWVPPTAKSTDHRLPCPQGGPGDQLVVKEHAWMWCEKVPNGVTPKGRQKFKYEPMRYAKIFYCSDHPEKPTIDVVSEYRGYEWGWRKKLGRFLPRWASRITLEVVSLRVEHLNAISAEDAKAEGIEYREGPGFKFYGELEKLDQWTHSPVWSYETLWESINGAGSWKANPWVWVITFRRLTNG